MSVELHRKAMDLAADADLMRIEGSVELAAEFMRRAGLMEAAVYEEIPEERVRTRSIIAVSVVSCLWQSNDPEMFRIYVDLYLTDGIQDWAKKQIRDMLARPAHAEGGEGK